MERETFQRMKFRGDRLRAARDAKGWSQTKLAQKIGAHVTSISDWERGANAPSGRHVVNLAQHLGVDVADFYEREASDDEEAAEAVTRRAAEGLVSALLAQVRRATADERAGTGGGAR